MAVDVTEQLILDALHKVPREHWQDLLEILHTLEPRPTQPVESRPRNWTAKELLALPFAQREAILEAQAELAEHDYRHDSELTAFEAFGIATAVALVVGKR
jgi:hypothetical protein